VVQGYRRGKVKALKPANLLERLNEELKRRTLAVRIFPSVSETLNHSPLIRRPQSSRQPNFWGMLRYVRDLCDALQAF
jgi:hypothetical protein